MENLFAPKKAYGSCTIFSFSEGEFFKVPSFSAFFRLLPLNSAFSEK